MPVATELTLESTFVDDLEGLYEHWQPTAVPQAELLALNADLAQSLGLDPEALRSPDRLAVLAGNAMPEHARPVAQAYSGHQFGGYSPRLGDGRALLLGEIVAPDGGRHDLHLKGSGRTPFARGGDGKAAVGPMLREYVIGEAMHALGVPTTRMLAVVATGESVARETMLPGAVLTRVASSHLRVGTFQYAAATGGRPLLQRLTDHAIDRHHPDLAGSDDPAERALALFDRVVAAQAELVARWMLVGFIHGVMNTDNTTISGQTIDYGPCAFMDAYDPATVFSSIDHGGRYAYGNQPSMAAWNLARLAEAMLPLFVDDDRPAGDDAAARPGGDANDVAGDRSGTEADEEKAVAAATEVLQTFPGRFVSAWQRGMRTKLGLAAAERGSGDIHGDHDADSDTATDGDTDGDVALIDDYLTLLHEHGVDFTSSFRALAALLRDGTSTPPLPENEATRSWLDRWRTRIATTGADPAEIADAMDSVNPLYIPRNHLVEEALAAATAGDLAPFEQLVAVVTDPFGERPGLERHTEPAPADFGRYRTFCGT